MKYKVFLHQYVEEIAEIEVEADTPEEAMEKGNEEAREGLIDWQDGGDVIVGAAAQVGQPVYVVKDMDDNEVWERL